MENPKHLECLLWGRPVVSTDHLSFIFVFDTHKVVSTPSKASSQRIQNWANNSYLGTFCSSVRHIAFAETMWSDASSRWITPPASARAIAFGAPLPRVRIDRSFFYPIAVEPCWRGLPTSLRDEKSDPEKAPFHQPAHRRRLKAPPDRSCLRGGAYVRHGVASPRREVTGQDG